jgi:hypothetical protein
MIAVEAQSHAVIDRFAFYHDFLTSDQTTKSCFLTDIRDVVFQGNPFSEPIGEESIKFFAEDRCFSPAETNYKWYEEVYGAGTGHILEGKPILCAGTTLAGRKGAIEYVSKMAAEIKRTGVARYGADQAIHNGLFYTGALPNAISVLNRQGEVQTLGLQASFTFDARGLLLNQDGSIPAVLHQYDRHAFLARHFLEPELTKRLSTKERRLKKLDKSRSAAFVHFLKVAILKSLH